MPEYTLSVGTLAYWDTVFSGLVPCRVVAITGPEGRPSADTTVEIELTANRGPYKRGERQRAWSIHVYPRGAVYAPRGCYFPRVRPYVLEH